MGGRRRDEDDRPRRVKRATANRAIVLLAGAAVLLVVVMGIAVLVLRGGIMSGGKTPSPRTPDEAWQRLVGSWSYTRTAGNSTSVGRYRFTPDRKMIFSTSLTGGVLPGALTSDISSNVSAVALEGDHILLTLGPRPGGRPGGVMTIRFVSVNQIVVEGSDPFTREE